MVLVVLVIKYIKVYHIHFNMLYLNVLIYTGTPKTIIFPFETNGKLMFL